MTTTRPQAIVTFTAKETARLLEKEKQPPVPGKGEVVARTLVSLISPGTELNSGYFGEKFPNEPGYAAVAEVTECGEEVHERQPGERVLVTGPGGIGGHRRYQRFPVNAAIPLPEGISPEAAVHARLVNVTFSALSTTTVRPPGGVLITGLGPVGHLGAQLFRAAGYEVMGVDPDPRRRAFAEDKGIPCLPAAPRDNALFKERTRLALECSGIESALLDCCHCVRRHGEVVLTGVPWRPRSEVHAHELARAVFRNLLTLRSGWEWQIPRHPDPFHPASVFGNIATALLWIAEGRIDAEGLYERRHPDDCATAYADLASGNPRLLTILFDWR
jgi:2-desacetyl-2-hydroxyethyl bacteriochlorophyllide A dehydrogenase